MSFYAYKGHAELGKERLGSEDKLIINDLKTVRGAKLRCDRAWGKGNYRLYSYSNFYDDKSFREIK